MSVITLTTICLAGVFFQNSLSKVFVSDRPFVGDPYVGYIHKLIYGGPGRGLFTILAMVLALGGLQRERLHKSVHFTLVLPVSRTRLVVSRALVGFMQIAALSLLPMLLIAPASQLMHVSYPFKQLLQFAALWMSGGAVFFAVTFLASTCFKSEYAALTLAFVFNIFYSLLAVFSPLSRYPVHIQHIMSGLAMPYFSARTAMLTGPLPWSVLAAMLIVSIVLVGLTIQVTKRQEYP